MSETLLIHENGNGEFSAFLPTSDARSFYDYLRSKGIPCELPRNVVETEGKGPIDAEVEFTSGRADIEETVLEWMRSGSYKTIHLNSDVAGMRWVYETSTIRGYLVSLIQQYNKRHGGAEPTKIFIPSDVEHDMAAHFIGEGGSLSAQIRQQGIRAAMPKIFGLDAVYGADELQLK